jgi:hypothetical protein
MVSQMTPRDLVAALEAHPAVPDGDGERFAGYGVMGVTFPSRDVLALRRFPASSVGPGYTSVWHRDRDGQWTFFQDVAAERGCARYFHNGIDMIAVAPIRIVWPRADTFSVMVDNGRRVEWEVRLGTSAVTRALTAAAARVPSRLWRVHAVVVVLSVFASVALRAGRVRLAGRTPTGHTFLAKPSGLWPVVASRAVIGGRDTGEAVVAREQHRLGGVWLPRRGLFAVAEARMAGFPSDDVLAR